jgi:hypothetical protein
MIPPPFPPSNLYTLHRPLSPPSPVTNLQSRLSILNQVLKIRLVPRSRLGTRAERILLSTKAIIPGSARIARSIRLATRLDPHKRIDEGVASGARGTHTEASALDVAPVAPLLAQARHAVAARVDDGLAWHACGLEFRREEGHELLLVLRLVPLRVGGFGELAGGEVVGVPARDVGGHAAHLLGAAGSLVDGGEFFGTGLWSGGQ